MRPAGLPSQLCLKTNWSGGFNNVDIHALEARFYYYLAVTVRSCRYGAVLRACQMAIDADLNGVIANVRNGVGH